MRERIVPAVSMFLSPSLFLLERFAEWGVPRERLRHVPTGIFARRGEARGPARSGPLRFTYLGALASHKGVHVLLEAWSLLDPQLRTRAQLDLWGPRSGEVEYIEGLERSAAACGAALHGPLAHDAVLGELERSDLLVVPSVWFENAPLVILEALAARTPVLVSDLGGAAESVREGETGFLFRVGDARDLARRLGELIADPAALARVAERAGEPTSFEETVDATLAAYDEALGEGPRAPAPEPVARGLGG